MALPAFAKHRVSAKQISSKIGALLGKADGICVCTGPFVTKHLVAGREGSAIP